jgi:DNA-binding NarL/FixJ family response regulator
MLNAYVAATVVAKVMVVEDDPHFRDALTHAVDSAPDMQLVGAAQDLPQGLRLLDAVAPDVLLVDIGLPSGSGIAVIRHAKHHQPQCESMVVTVFADDRLVVECIEAGATGYLLKDAQPLDMVQQIRLLLAGGSPISPAIARRLLRRIGGELEQHDVTPQMRTALSAQERLVLSFSAKGYSYGEIANLLNRSRHTVETYVKRIYQKLHVNTKTAAVYEARKLGLVDD